MNTPIPLTTTTRSSTRVQLHAKSPWLQGTACTAPSLACGMCGSNWSRNCCCLRSSKGRCAFYGWGAPLAPSTTSLLAAFARTLCTRQGAVDVFVRSYKNAAKTEYDWVFSTTLVPASRQLSDRIGSSLSISNFTIVAGAPTRSLLINPRANVVRTTSPPCPPRASSTHALGLHALLHPLPAFLSLCLGPRVCARKHICRCAHAHRVRHTYGASG